MILHNVEGLRGLLYDKHKENPPPEETKINERIIAIERKINKFDERLNYCMGELDSYNKVKSDLDELVKLHGKSKDNIEQ
ncbi:MAG: hypothetical protein OEW86_05400 [Nitrosopumilus sp.]|nr:hypothetical protein [Nitrosopumilus sp.]